VALAAFNLAALVVVMAWLQRGPRRRFRRIAHPLTQPLA
jgi:hypothetical protein